MASLSKLLPRCLIWLPLAACTPDAGTPQSVEERRLSDRQEMIEQLRELIRYEDETERERREALRTLTLPVDGAAAAKAGVTAGEGQDQHQH